MHWSKTRWHPYMQAELLVCFFAPSFSSLALSLFRLSCDQRQLSPGTPLFRHKGYVKTRQRLQSCNGTAQLLKRCCVPWWDTCVCRLSVCVLEKKTSVYSQWVRRPCEILTGLWLCQQRRAVFLLFHVPFIWPLTLKHTAAPLQPPSCTPLHLCAQTRAHTRANIHPPTHTHTHIFKWNRVIHFSLWPSPFLSYYKPYLPHPISLINHAPDQRLAIRWPEHCAPLLA